MGVASELRNRLLRGTGARLALKVTAAYVLVAFAWVLLFYRLLPVLIRNQPALELFTTTRVLFTAAVLYVVTWFAFDRLRRAQQRIVHLNAVLRAIRGVNQLITRQKNRDRLLEQSCGLLASTLGYRSAWILLLDEDGRFAGAAHAGLEERAEEFLDRLRRGDYPDCVRRCLREKSEQVLSPPRLSCRDCPLEHIEPGSSAQVAPLLYQGRLLGVMGLSLPAHVEPTAEEKSLVAEVAADIAFALHTLDAEAERRRAEENVATLKRQMEFVLGATKTGLDIIDSDLNIRYVDPEWQKVYGDPKGKKCYEYFMGRSDPCPDCGVALALRTKQPVVTEEILVREGGRPIQVTTIPFQDERGEWLVAEVNVDISERKRAEVALRESEEELSAIFNSAPVAMVVVDAERSVVAANKAAAALSGHPVKDMVGFRPGTALGCLNALASPAGCGFGEACQTCGLRQAALDTLHTGAGHYSEEVTLPFQGPKGPDEHHLLISTASIEAPAGRVALVCLEDVTEQKRAEREVISLARFPAENPHPTLRVSTDGLVIYANRPAELLLNTIGCRSGDPLPEPYRRQVVEALASGARRDVEATVQDRTFAVTIAPIVEAGYVNIYARDITDRKQAEEAREQYKKAVEESPTLVTAVDRQYRYLFVNKAWLRYNRLSPSEAVGRTPADVFGKRWFEESLKPRLDRAFAGDVVNFEVSHQYPELGQRDLSVSYFPLKGSDGQVQAVVADIRDVTEQKRLEEALQKSEGLYRALVEQSATYTLTLQAGRIRYANPAAVRAVGYTLEEMGAKPAFDFIHPQDRAQTQEAIERASLGETVEGVELRVLTKAGDTRWVQFSATRIDFEGQPAVLVNGLDVTQQKQLEQQLLQSAKLTAIGELISGVAHELNNPLAAVLGYTELAQELGLEGELSGYLEKIAEQAARASGIVGNLLVFARQKEPEREPVSLNAVVSSTLDLRGYELRVSNIQVVAELDEALPYIEGDSQQLVQVVLNLINNAEHAIRKHRDTGTITVRTSPFSRGGRPWTRLEVLDDGPGIPEPLLRRIFEPFFTTKELGEGTGLGLSVSYGIVTAHQGFIYAENRPEGGAHFVVELPTAEAAGFVAVSKPETPAVKPARILVVEDEKAVATMLARLLTGDGHQVSIAGEGAEALARVQAEPFDLIITDFKMSGMSGLEFFRSLTAAHPGFAHRVIFTTGDVFSVDTRRFLAEVGAPVLDKPFTLDQARSIIYGKLQEVQS